MTTSVRYKRNYSKHRFEKDVLVLMPTGGGKIDYAIKYRH